MLEWWSLTQRTVVESSVMVTHGSEISFTAPFGGPPVLYLMRRDVFDEFYGKR
jgi:hypothetical protein